ncbi:MAG: ribulose-phosphate 3-epimerase [Alkaliphilus sp.]|nr:ribulose-phosphate 3-epimerase [Alkaliphilus sp.]
MVKIAPSILSADFANLMNDIKKVEKGGADYLHIDVMDGHFVPNITIGPLVLESIKNHTNLPFDVHLMIESPDLYIEQFVKAQANIITVHIEASRHIHRTIQNIKSYGIKAGISLNPGTPISAIECILEEVDMVLVMSVNPGFGGQSFIPSALQKIKDLKTIISNRKLDIEIEVDGGIKLENACEVVKAGADIIVSGSAIFHSSDVIETVKSFRHTINNC